MKLVLLARAYCHLCAEMEAELAPLLGAATLEVVDVDATRHAALEAAFGDCVPVLFAHSPEPANEICRFRLDHRRLYAALAEKQEIR